jgi:transcriptional regulator with GAF, ATPase, and Fis domain
VLAVALSATVLAADAAWRLIQHGASDVLAWDGTPDPAGDIVARLDRWNAVDELVESPAVRARLIGRSACWVSILRRIVETARFTDAPVLVVGESGTGKELVAATIHELDQRPDKREFVVLDCASVVPELAGSEFFGHERGSFTGAIASRDGAFALADGGTLFLDEVGELPASLQAELLRVVQEGTYKRIGSNIWRQTHFRLVCATNRDLRLEEAEGRFRRDFYYRIAGVTCALPPLRDRTDDIIPLARHLFTQLKSSPGPPEVDEAVRRFLLQRPYPGNVRDLRRVVMRIAQRHVGSGPISIGDIPEEERPPMDTGSTGWKGDRLERAVRHAIAMGAGLRDITAAAAEIAIQVAVEEEQGNLQRAARRLGVTDRALQLRRVNRRLRLKSSDAHEVV